MPNPGVTLAQVEIAPSLFTWPAEQPQLIGSRCDSCAALTFPVQSHCPSCGGTTSEHHLPRTGTLHTWTTQEFPPVAPPYLAPVGKEFQPYGIGWVDLQGEIMVEARLTEADPAKLRFDMPVELVVIPFATDADGNEVMTYAFAPVTEQ